jgi:hypothetical protein
MIHVRNAICITTVFAVAGLVVGVRHAAKLINLGSIVHARGVIFTTIGVLIVPVLSNGSCFLATVLTRISLEVVA